MGREGLGWHPSIDRGTTNRLMLLETIDWFISKVLAISWQPPVCNCNRTKPSPLFTLHALIHYISELFLARISGEFSANGLRVRRICGCWMVRPNSCYEFGMPVSVPRNEQLQSFQGVYKRSKGRNHRKLLQNPEGLMCGRNHDERAMAYYS